MKKFLLILLLFLAGFFIFKSSARKNTNTSTGQIIPTPTQTVENSKPKVMLNGKAYAYDYFLVSDVSKISLIPNFTAKLDARTLIEQNNCKAAINGGFYDTAYKPLGLFISDGTIQYESISSRLFNGFIWISKSGDSGIANNEPFGNLRIALQTGPLLLMNGTPLPLAIQNDEGRRRMVAAINNKNEMIFLSVFREEATFEGPLLATLPAVVSKINTQENLHVTDAVNLDGGSASVFYTSDFTLRELTTAGSLFCLR